MTLLNKICLEYINIACFLLQMTHGRRLLGREDGVCLYECRGGAALAAGEALVELLWRSNRAQISCLGAIH